MFMFLIHPDIAIGRILEIIIFLLVFFNSGFTKNFARNLNISVFTVFFLFCIIASMTIITVVNYSRIETYFNPQTQPIQNKTSYIVSEKNKPPVQQTKTRAITSLEVEKKLDAMDKKPQIEMYVEKPVIQTYTDPNGNIWVHMKAYDVSFEEWTGFIHFEFKPGDRFSIWPSGCMSVERIHIEGIEDLAFDYCPEDKVNSKNNAANYEKKYKSKTGKMETITAYWENINQ